MARKPSPAPESFDCPNCGEPVRVGAAVCRECGSDARTGWQGAEELDYQAVEVPDGWGPEDEPGPVSAARRRWFRLVVALVLVVVLVAVTILR